MSIRGAGPAIFAPFHFVVSIPRVTDVESLDKTPQKTN